MEPKTDATRWCRRCRRDVHDLSAMAPEDALRLLDQPGDKLCVRYGYDEEGVLVFDPTPLVTIRRPPPRLDLELIELASVAVLTY